MTRTFRSRMQSCRLPLIPVTVLALVLLPHARVALHAAEGDLDPTFGSAGKLLTDFGGTFDIAEEVAVQPDGKIVVAGVRTGGGSNNDFAFARYNTDGSLDTTFGTGGIVFTDLNGGSSDWARAMALQPDGKIVLAGETASPVLPSDQDFALVRYNSDGSLDTTFGTGGIVFTDFGAQFWEGAFSVGIDSAGRIVAAGGTFDWTTQRNFAVARYNPDGSLDTTFDGDGRVTTPLSLTNADIIADVAIQADDRIVAVGNAGSDFAVVRYDTDGSLDTTFGGTGIITTNFGGTEARATAVVMQPDGKVLAAGTTSVFGNIDAVLLRYNADGSPDASFGAGGQSITDFEATDLLNDVALQADGKIVVTGRILTAGSGQDDFALVRFEADGTVDVTFGVAGLVRTDIGSGSSDEARGIAIQTDGRILVVGMVAFGTAVGFADFGIARYEGPPPHDVKFYLHGTDIAGTAGGFTMNTTAPSTQVLVTASNNPSWFSDPVVNGTFLTGSTFQVKLPCVLGVGLPKTVRLASTDSSGGNEQLLGQAAVGVQLCQSQTIAVPVATPATLLQRRLKLTIVSPLPVSTVILGSQTFVRATNFVGAP
jgi:uncharacterized delta-60 repeat protein